MELICLSFCTKCGTELVDGITHECSIQTTIHQTAATQAVHTSPKSISFNVNLLQRLLINPFAAKTLDSNTDFIEGISGIGAVAVGMFIWLAAVASNLTSSFKNIPLLRNSISPDYGYILLAAIFTALLPLVTTYIVSYFLCHQKPSFKQAIMVLGATQWLFALVSVVLAIVFFISALFSTTLFVGALITNIVLLFLVSFDLFDIPEHKRIITVFLAVSIAIIVWGLTAEKLMVSAVSKGISGIQSMFGGY